ncbi:RNA polymerase subunit sigma [Lysinibacillus varians]|uniref:RNA polymerase subunit sigma n=1 Tax=Lysinibacillus varians TaxID=1145276 RepID=A0ABY2T4F0_9BACI|nr:RNA polymerase subunit sigma [Lysinibacillus varians]
MTKFGKYLYITFIMIVFLLSSIWDYFKNNHWALLENFLFSLWIAVFLFMAAILLRKTKVKEK